MQLKCIDKSFTGKDYYFVIIDYPVSSSDDFKGFYKIDKIQTYYPAKELEKYGMVQPHVETLFQVVNVDTCEFMGRYETESDAMDTIVNFLYDSLTYIKNKIVVQLSPKYKTAKEQEKKEKINMSIDSSSFDFAIVNHDSDVIVGLYKIMIHRDEYNDSNLKYSIKNLYTGEETNPSSDTIHEAVDKVMTMERKWVKEGTYLRIIPRENSINDKIYNTGSDITLKEVKYPIIEICKNNNSIKYAIMIENNAINGNDISPVFKIVNLNTGEIEGDFKSLNFANVEISKKINEMILNLKQGDSFCIKKIN